MQSRHLFLDCDGVLADFDSAAELVLGMPPTEAQASLGNEVFWQELQGREAFYESMGLLPDARELFQAVAHLKPTLLTGCPLGGWAEAQKTAWAGKHFPGVTIVTCKSSDKCLHMQPGDVLVDDYPRYRHLWEEAGGIFVLHTSTADTLRELRELGILECVWNEAGS